MRNVSDSYLKGTANSRVPFDGSTNVNHLTSAPSATTERLRAEAFFIHFLHRNVRMKKEGGAR